MEFRVKEFINDKYAKAVNILKNNLKENYHVFYGVRLSEVLFPASEYGSEAFFKEFEAINSITLPIIIFDLKEQKPIVIISFEEVSDAAVLEEVGIAVIVCNNLSDLLTKNNLTVLYGG
ncbi:TPA: DNA distortion polypeptide 3 [Yersinia enterocolitica]